MAAKRAAGGRRFTSRAVRVAELVGHHRAPRVPEEGGPRAPECTANGRRSSVDGSGKATLGGFRALESESVRCSWRHSGCPTVWGRQDRDQRDGRSESREARETHHFQPDGILSKSRKSPGGAAAAAAAAAAG